MYQINTTVTGDYNKDSFLFGSISEITEKAVKIQFETVSVWNNNKANRQKFAWIPKSCLVYDSQLDRFFIKSWFMDKIKPINA